MDAGKWFDSGLRRTAGRVTTNGVGGGEEGTHKGRPQRGGGVGGGEEGTHKGRPYVERVVRCGWWRQVRTMVVDVVTWRRDRGNSG